MTAGTVPVKDAIRVLQANGVNVEWKNKKLSMSKGTVIRVLVVPTGDAPMLQRRTVHALARLYNFDVNHFYSPPP